MHINLQNTRFFLLLIQHILFDIDWNVGVTKKDRRYFITISSVMIMFKKCFI